MRTLALFAVIAAVAVLSSAVKYTPPKRKCAWNVELTFKNDNGVQKVYKYWVNGRFLAKEEKNSQGDVIDHAIIRPDLDGQSFRYNSGQCKVLSTVEAGLYWADDLVALSLFEKEWDFAQSKPVTYNGKEGCTEYYTGNTHLFVDKDGEPIALDVAGFGKADIDFGGKAWMSDFSLSSSKEGGCNVEEAYKSGNDEFAFCAASSVKAVLALVLAAIATALLALF